MGQQPQIGRNLLAGRRAPLKLEQPEWHAPWKLMRVISGHLGWVRTIAVDPTNEWFATGSNDRTIKIWDLASGSLKLTLTGHISTVRALCISDRHPYLFSAGDDKLVKCWDLEMNKAVRSYHGHLSGVYCASLHPTLDVLVTGGRDAAVRVWDVRTAAPVFVLGGHTNTVSAIVTQASEPQIISGSMDSTVRLWDLAAGKSRATLTNHKKSVRALALHPKEYTFMSGSADNLKKWKCPDGEFLQNLPGHNTIINSLTVNEDGVMVSAGDNGTMLFWDWKTGHCFQQQMTIAQPGSLEAEHGVYTVCYDRSGSRLLSGEADKTIKVWKEDPEATPQTHPVQYNPVKEPKRY
ncbi:WD40-repeat-containing domain protein [Pavlovales sp. CCMP2436]|nr:WD40-repeat-containing domain protein [Pavlovales sp. CCMP2436]